MYRLQKIPLASMLENAGDESRKRKDCFLRNAYSNLEDHAPCECSARVSNAVRAILVTLECSITEGCCIRAAAGL